MKNQEIPPTLHFETLNPYVPGTGNPFYVSGKLETWHRMTDDAGKSRPLRAGISSFGFGGTNAHVILEEYRGRDIQREIRPEALLSENAGYLFVFSAKSKSSLMSLIREFAGYSEKVEKETAQAGTEQLFLRNAAFTLQTGRDEMPVRLAIVVSGISGLRDSLNRAFNSDVAIKKVFHGQVDASTLEDPAGEPYTTFPGADLEKIGKWWVSGGPVEWSGLYQGHTPSRVSLPAYCFERSRHWVGETGLSLRAGPDKTRMTVRLRGREPYLRDHIVGGRHLVPGVLALELARAVGAEISETPVTKIRKHAWLSPAGFDRGPLDISVRLERDGHRTRYHIHAGGAHGQSHATGEIAFDAGQAPDPLDIAAIKNNSRFMLTDSECYHRLNRIGFQYGPGFRVIRKLWGNNTHVLCRVRPAETKTSQANRPFLHPVIMDAALQAASGIPDIPGYSPGGLYLPFSLSELDIFTQVPLSGPCYVYAERLAGPGGRAMPVYNIRILDGSGHPLVVFKEFGVRPVAVVNEPAPPVFDGALARQLLKQLYNGDISPDNALAQARTLHPQDSADKPPALQT